MSLLLMLVHLVCNYFLILVSRVQHQEPRTGLRGPRRRALDRVTDIKSLQQTAIRHLALAALQGTARTVMAILNSRFRQQLVMFILYRFGYLKLAVM